MYNIKLLQVEETLRDLKKHVKELIRPAMVLLRVFFFVTAIEKIGEIAATAVLSNNVEKLIGLKNMLGG